MTDESVPWVVLGLGNPGPAYESTRHNIGAMAVQEWVRSLGGRLRSQRRARCDVWEGRVEGQRIVVAVPRSFMNESGGPASAALGFYAGQPSRFLVIHDELDLPFTTLRIKYAGGDNGHNGLRGIRRSLGTGEWYRIRLGIGRPSGRGDPVDHVLAGFGATERKHLPDFLQRAGLCAESLIEHGLAATQNDFNS